MTRNNEINEHNGLGENDENNENVENNENDRFLLKISRISIKFVPRKLDPKIQ